MPGIFPVSIVVARAVEDVVGDLERDAERQAELAEARRRRRARTRPRRASRSSGRSARRYSSTVVSGRAAASAGAPRRARAPAMRRRARATASASPDVGELGERAGEEVVAGRPRGAPRRAGAHAAGWPRRSARAVDQVVVDERRHVDELDRGARGDRASPPRSGGADEEDEHRPQPLAAGRERLGADRGDEARMARRPPARAAPRPRPGTRRGRAPRGPSRACAHRAPLAVCSATIAAAETGGSASPSKPARPISDGELLGPGKRRTLAGRYV